MYVFHDRRLEALERTDDILAIAIERLVEATSFGSEPEDMARVLNVFTFARWLGECPDVAGLAPTRRALRDTAVALARSVLPRQGATLANALASEAALAPPLQKLRSDSLRHDSDILLGSVTTAEPLPVVSAAGALATAWLGTLLHPQTVFNKLVGYVLDPDEKQPTTTVSQRLTEVVEDFARRVPQPHTTEVSIEMPAGKNRPLPPALAGIHVTAQAPASNRLVLRTEVMAADPNAAASRGRARFIETVNAWRAGAPDLRIAIPTAISVTMPDGVAIAVEVRSFRIAAPRISVVPSWADVPASEQSRFSTVADAITRARDELDQNRGAQAISTLWSSSETFLRCDSETTVAPSDLERRLAASFMRYFVTRQFALLGLYLDMSRATRPRVKSPVDPVRLWRGLSNGELQARISGQRAFLRFRIATLLRMLVDPTMLPTVLHDLRGQIRDVLFAARMIRNAHVHSRARIAVEFEERYVYRWLETLLDVALNAALGQSRRADFTMDGHLGSLVQRLMSFEQRAAAGPPYDWLLRT